MRQGYPILPYTETIATYYRIATYIQQHGGRVLLSTLMMDNRELTEELYGFLVDFGYLAQQADSITYATIYTVLGPIWYARMRAAGYHTDAPLKFTTAAEDEIDRYAKQLRLTDYEREVFRVRCEVQARGSELVSLLSVVAAERLQSNEVHYDGQ